MLFIFIVSYIAGDRESNLSLSQDDNEEELELEIEQIPDDVLHQLLRFVRGLRPLQTSPDEDYEPPTIATSGRKGAGSGGHGHKPKKSKPMNKFEQEQQIKALRDQLREFEKPGGAGLDSPEDGGFLYICHMNCH